MAREKQWVFSARTTEEGLKALNEVKSCFNIGWDELVIDAVSAHYNLDKDMMTLSKKEATAKPAKNEAEQPPAEENPQEQPAAAETEQPAEEGRQASARRGSELRRQLNGSDYWFDVGNRWCWRCWRFTRHYGHTLGGAVCVRYALLRDSEGKDGRKDR